MVEERLADGTRIAQLLASEVDGRSDGALAALSVTEADREVEPSAEGAFAYAIEQGERTGNDRRIASVYVHPDRAHVEFAAGQETVVKRAEDEGLRVRPKAVDPPRTLVFIEDGAEVKRTTSVIEGVVQSN